MWLLCNNAWLSVVEHRNDPNTLVVRARVRDHLLNVFGRDCQPVCTPKADYGYRVLVSRREMAWIVGQMITGINYDNFKDSVQDDTLHSAYMRVWTIGHGMQHKIGDDYEGKLFGGYMADHGPVARVPDGPMGGRKGTGRKGRRGGAPKQGKRS